MSGLKDGAPQEARTRAGSDWAWASMASRHPLRPLVRFTKKPWGTYPRCQYVNDYDAQCSATAYSDDLCYGHFQDFCAGRIALQSSSDQGANK